jgi:hypothetical protein
MNRHCFLDPCSRGQVLAEAETQSNQTGLLPAAERAVARSA